MRLKLTLNQVRFGKKWPPPNSKSARRADYATVFLTLVHFVVVRILFLRNNVASFFLMKKDTFSEMYILKSRFFGKLPQNAIKTMETIL